MNVYIKKELVVKLIQAEIEDVPKYVNDAIEEKLAKEANE